jgi:hypothetical protein
MANLNAPRGLKPVKKLGGGSVTNSTYTIATGAGAIYVGDVVELTGTGKNIQQVTAGNLNSLGVFGGCSYKASDGSIVHNGRWPGSVGATEAVAIVYDDPDIVYAVQANTCAEADVGQLADWATSGGTASTGMSVGYLNVSAGTAVTGKDFQIIGLVPDGNNDYGAYAKVLVRFAQHAYRGDAATNIGV